jgi:hypothetical protein
LSAPSVAVADTEYSCPSVRSLDARASVQLDVPDAGTVVAPLCQVVPFQYVLAVVSSSVTATVATGLATPDDVPDTAPDHELALKKDPEVGAVTATEGAVVS